MFIIHSNKAIIAKEKLSGYLLSSSHPVGHSKSTFFHSHGYTANNVATLEKDIRSLLTNEVVKTIQTTFGKKFEIRGTILSPSGKTLYLTSVWIILENEDFPRFVTAYPGGKQ